MYSETSGREADEWLFEGRGEKTFWKGLRPNNPGTAFHYFAVSLSGRRGNLA